MAMASITSDTKNQGWEVRCKLVLLVLLRGPGQPQERQPLTRQLHLQLHLSIRGSDPLRRIEELQLPRGLQLCVLFRGWALRRAHFFPDGVSVAVIVVDTVMLQQHAMGGDSFDRYRDFRTGSGDVFVMIVPQH